MTTANPFDHGRTREEVRVDLIEHVGDGDYILFGILLELEAADTRDAIAAERARIVAALAPWGLDLLAFDEPVPIFAAELLAIVNGEGVA